MNGPEIHLRYGVTEGRKGDAVSFTQGQPKKQYFDDFALVFEGGELRAFTDKYDSVDSARAALEPKLRDWEKYARIGRLRIGFWFSGAEETVVGPQGTVHTAALVNIMPARINVTVSNVTVSPSTMEVQLPPSQMRESELAETIFSKLRDLEDGPETIWTSVAYAIVNAIEETSGTLAAASKRYNVGTKVLKKLKTYSSGDHPTASRKPMGKGKPLTTRDLEWVRGKAMETGYRVLEVEYCDNVDKLDKITS
jgi:hypothetical protein